MAIHTRISAFTDLGQLFKSIVPSDLVENAHSSEKDSKIQQLIESLKLAEIHNSWFTPENLSYALNQWSQELTQQKLENWLKKYSYAEHPKNVGMVLAGNIPMVGFHDLLSVLLSGNNAIVKTSSKDKILMDFIIDFLRNYNEDLAQAITKVDRLEEYDAIIATGSNNTARYFEYYFGKVPNIIRKNRTSVAVLDGNETKEDLKKLGEDIFMYFGLGCRNVTKLYLPKGFNTDLLFESFYEWNSIINHAKYANNYDYNRTVYLMSNENVFLDNNFVILKESQDLHSPIGVIYFEYYEELNKVKLDLQSQRNNIQCIVGHAFPETEISVSFGETQHPSLTDYADGVNVMDFLENLKN
jgi:hypothetical protein